MLPTMETPTDPDAVQGIALDDDGNIISDDLAMAENYSEGDMELPMGDASTGQGTAIYFGYDSADVSEKYMNVIQETVLRLQGSPSARLRLEGHTDERGTRAYNLALGERRAQSVRDIVLEQGVLSEQVDLISYGEELPAVTGQGEKFWVQNRRVELIVEE